MTGNKDSAEIIEFMSSFQKLREYIDDDLNGLIELANRDEDIKSQCLWLSKSAYTLSNSERRQQAKFAAPVNPDFIKIWREFEERYEDILEKIYLNDLIGDLDFGTHDYQSRSDKKWEIADAEGMEKAGLVKAASDFASEQVMDEGHEFPDGFPEEIEKGVIAWESLQGKMVGWMRGVYRRSEIIPFILIPRHVAAKYGKDEKLTLYKHIQQAHDAFIYGAPFATLALMRSIMEKLLRDHYGAPGCNLEERIDNCDGLGLAAGPEALHRLRKLTNAILHFNQDARAISFSLDDTKRFEMEVVSLLVVIRALIEEAPKYGQGKGRAV